MTDAGAGSGLQTPDQVPRGAGAGAVVVVALRAAAREISKTAAVWALTHVVQHGDSILLLVLIPPPSSGRKFWGFPFFAGSCASGHKAVLNQRSDVAELCSQMVRKLRDVYDPNNKIDVKVKILSGSPPGAVAKESKRVQAAWVVLDKELKHEEKRCMEELQCNIVAMKRSQPKVLRLNLTPAGASDRLVGNRPRPRRTPTADSLLEKIAKLDLLTEISAIRSRSDLNFRGNVRDAVALDRSAPPGPPPLCSICQHKAPVFGKPPRWFSYAELEVATGGFSRANFLAEGGFGSVHRGVLPDGRAVAVKQHRLASSQGDVEFCSEVEVLSCAQHRNVVMLIGFCVENKRRLLVYEYICNGSLDTHLYDRNKETLEWAARHKIAVGAARGLRYLHEECRVGCIIHRDMRPNNILVTHDFEPLVGDFGLARWQPDGDMGVETRVIGTFGYLAPEYAQSGQITEKADVYSFGVVLVELVTGRKAVDINRPKGQQFLTEWVPTFF
ncbi:Inactive protein kinase [Zea mays]|uniref:non-specific serine/threonine protein kinase n=1 Tax=Zea mays TaxID=4577 RepID=A0A3L6EDF9_MAIZE|nr:Inactive protein kinase [Zea mays]